MARRKPAAKPAAKRLTPRQRKWVAAMVEHGHLGDAAKAAGVTYDTSREYHAEERYAHVRQALDKALAAVQEAAAEKAGYTAEQACEELAHVYRVALTLDRPDLKAATSAVMGRAKILGLDNHAKRVDLAGAVEMIAPQLDFSALTDEEVELYATLQAKIEGDTDPA